MNEHPQRIIYATLDPTLYATDHLCLEVRVVRESMLVEFEYDCGYKQQFQQNGNKIWEMLPYTQLSPPNPYTLTW